MAFASEKNRERKRLRPPMQEEAENENDDDERVLARYAQRDGDFVLVS